MKVFTVVDGVSYPGTFSREQRLIWGRDHTPVFVFASYLSADLGGGNYVSVDAFDVDEDFLRKTLSGAIRKKLADGRLH